MENVHSINNQGTIGGIFPHGIAKLLNRLNGIFMENLLPASHINRRPVAIDPADGDQTVFPDLGQNIRDECWLSVVTVNEQSYFPAFFFSKTVNHSASRKPSKLSYFTYFLMIVKYQIYFGRKLKL